MYTKNDGWVYFDSKKELQDQATSDRDEFVAHIEKKIPEIWEFYCYPCEDWHKLHAVPIYEQSYKKYRRRITPEFKVRTSFKIGDPVCWCGCNGEVTTILFYNSNFHVYCHFPAINCDDVRFTKHGRLFHAHKKPSLLHGHDVLKVEDQKIPVERAFGCKEAKHTWTPAANNAPSFIQEERPCKSCKFVANKDSDPVLCMVHGIYKDRCDTCLAYQEKETE